MAHGESVGRRGAEAMSVDHRVEIRRFPAGQWYAVVVDANGKTALLTEAHDTRESLDKCLENFCAWMYRIDAEWHEYTSEVARV